MIAIHLALVASLVCYPVSALGLLLVPVALVVVASAIVAERRRAA